MNPDQKEQLDQHLKAIAQILVDNTPEEQISNFEGIETALRDHWLTTLGPAIGSFFLNQQQEPEQGEPKA
jgi:hypothetical protein